MSRPPSDAWLALGEDQDPIPGDPHEVHTEASRLRQMAELIEAQVRTLHEISENERLVGEYADKIRASARNLAGSLDKTHGRYRNVSSHLAGWAGDLDHCQSASLRILLRAQDAVARGADVSAMAEPKTDAVAMASLTDAQKQQATADHARIEHARTDLDQAKHQLDQVKAERDDRARYWAHLIKRDVHDGVKDSGWDRFRSWVDHHAGLLKVLADSLTYLATAAAILAIFIPVVGEIELGVLSAAILAGAAGVHTVLAATGNGSWTEVAMDALVLLSFGVVKWATIGAKGAEEGASIISKLLGSADIDATIGELTGTAEHGVPLTVEKAGVTAVEDVGGAAERVANETVASTTPLQRLMAGGEVELARSLATVTSIRQALPDSAAIAAAARTANSFANVARGSFFVGNALDQIGHWAGDSDLLNALTGGHAPKWLPYIRLKDFTTVSSQWSTPASTP